MITLWIGMIQCQSLKDEDQLIEERGETDKDEILKKLNKKLKQVCKTSNICITILNITSFRPCSMWQTLLFHHVHSFRYFIRLLLHLGCPDKVGISISTKD